MTKKRLFIIIPLCVIVLPILIYKAFAFHASQQFVESTPPDNTANSLKEVAISMLYNYEFFTGEFDVKYMERDRNGLQNKAQIRMHNTSLGDDSILEIEYIAIAEKKGELWRITSYKSHWKCARHVIPQFWQTSPCI